MLRYIFSQTFVLFLDQRIAFLIDASSDVKKQSNFDKIKNFLVQFVGLHTSPKHHKLGLVTYGDKPILNLGFEEEQSDEIIENAARNIKYVCFVLRRLYFSFP